MEDVIYSLIRCTLIHECTLSESIILGNEEVFSWSNNIITLPPQIILGLIEAVEEEIAVG